MLGGLASSGAAAQKFGPDSGPPAQGQTPRYGPAPSHPDQSPGQGFNRNRPFFIGRWQATDTALGSAIVFDMMFGGDDGFTNRMTFPLSGTSISMVGQWSLVGPSSVQL